MNEINCQMIVCILVVLIMFQDRLYHYLVRAGFRFVHVTLDKPTASLSTAI